MLACPASFLKKDSLRVVDPTSGNDNYVYLFLPLTIITYHALRITINKREVLMLYISVFDAKEEVSIGAINREREEWYKKGRDKIFQKMCKRIDRYEVVGKSPLRIIFIIETDNLHALNMLTHHFGNEWITVTYPAMQREMHEAMVEDKSIIGG